MTVNTLAIDLRTVELQISKFCKKTSLHSGEFGGTSAGDFLDSKGGELLFEFFELFCKFEL